ncbi:hypothetical protein DENIT_10642 [Pseudomonas veronii]|nr:hypothetical protein DENIT_10642 [Pseudomonas veronii]
MFGFFCVPGRRELSGHISNQLKYNNYLLARESESSAGGGLGCVVLPWELVTISPVSTD